MTTDANEPSGKEPGKWLPLLLAVFFALCLSLGALTARAFVFLVRALFSENLPALLLHAAIFCLLAAASAFSFRKFRAFSLARGATGWLGVNTLALGAVLFLAGAAAWRLTWVSPMERMVAEDNAARKSCQENATAMLAVSRVTESHIPWSGFILVKATLLAKRPLVVDGEDWLPDGPVTSGFSSAAQLTELQPGQPKDIYIRLINPVVNNVSRPVNDGPYYFPEVRAYVTDPAYDGGRSCRVTLIRNLATGHYSSADFGSAKIKLAGDKPPFKELAPGRTPPPYTQPEPLSGQESILLNGGYAEMFKAALPLALAGDAAAQFNLGLLYGKDRGAEQSMKWLHKAAQQELADAQYELGLRYGYGQGAPLDPAAAFDWLRKAAGKGHKDAQYELGLAYTFGRGVPASPKEAEAWFRKAAGK
ncbi:MAG TPA: tetratricopeptide repeat protein [Elusimicrobiales bacterium]|nr:tetratricopeptide repeat protein [Elusimicrobiales bacterium]